MQALSVRQPWAWAILYADKRVENRDWAGFGPRGPLLLHTGKTCTRREYADGVEAIHDARRGLGLPAVEVPPLADLPRGGLVGVIDVVGAAVNADDADGYAVPGALGIHIDEVRPGPFVPMLGALGLWSPVWQPEHRQARELYEEAVRSMRRPAAPCPGCGRPIDPRIVACPRCWRRVPRPLQHDLWAALRQVGRASEPYRTARAAAQAALRRIP